MKRHFVIRILLLIIALPLWSQDSQNCTLIGRWANGPTPHVADGSGGLRIIDVSSHSAPVKAGSFIAKGLLNDVFFQDKFAYMAESNGL